MKPTLSSDFTRILGRDVIDFFRQQYDVHATNSTMVSLQFSQACAALGYGTHTLDKVYKRHAGASGMTFDDFLAAVSSLEGAEHGKSRPWASAEVAKSLRERFLRTKSVNSCAQRLRAALKKPTPSDLDMALIEIERIGSITLGSGVTPSSKCSRKGRRCTLATSPFVQAVFKSVSGPLKRIWLEFSGSAHTVASSRGLMNSESWLKASGFLKIPVAEARNIFEQGQAGGANMSYDGFQSALCYWCQRQCPQPTAGSNSIDVMCSRRLRKLLLEDNDLRSIQLNHRIRRYLNPDEITEVLRIAERALTESAQVDVLTAKIDAMEDRDMAVRVSEFKHALETGCNAQGIYDALVASQSLESPGGGVHFPARLTALHSAHPRPSPSHRQTPKRGTTPSGCAPTPKIGTASTSKAQTPKLGTASTSSAQTPKIGTASPSRTQTPKRGTASPYNAQTPKIGTASPSRAQTPKIGTASPYNAQTPKIGTASPSRAQTPKIGTASPSRAQTPKIGTASTSSVQTPKIGAASPSRTQTPKIGAASPYNAQTPKTGSASSSRAQTPKRVQASPSGAHTPSRLPAPGSGARSRSSSLQLRGKSLMNSCSGRRTGSCTRIGTTASPLCAAAAPQSASSSRAASPRVSPTRGRDQSASSPQEREAGMWGLPPSQTNVVVATSLCDLRASIDELKLAMERKDELHANELLTCISERAAELMSHRSPSPAHSQNRGQETLSPGRASPSSPGRASPSACGRASPLSPGRASPSACGRASPLSPGRASPSACGRASPLSPGRASPSACGRASPLSPGRASPSVCGRASPLSPGRASPSACGRASPLSPGRASPCALKAQHSSTSELRRNHGDATEATASTHTSISRNAHSPLPSHSLPRAEMGSTGMCNVNSASHAADVHGDDSSDGELCGGGGWEIDRAHKGWVSFKPTVQLALDEAWENRATDVMLGGVPYTVDWDALTIGKVGGAPRRLRHVPDDDVSEVTMRNSRDAFGEADIMSSDDETTFSHQGSISEQEAAKQAEYDDDLMNFTLEVVQLGAFRQALLPPRSYRYDHNLCLDMVL